MLIEFFAVGITLTNKSNHLLGGEPNMFDIETEVKGVQEILEALTDQEKEEMSDTSMPIRHFRAEKVRTKKSTYLCSLLCPVGSLFV
jgi:hypothetical protein